MRAALAAGAVTLLLGFSAHSQPDGKRVAESGPTPQRNAAHKAGDGEAPTEKPPLAVRIIKTDDDPIGSAAKEAKSEKRQDDDLIAQQSAASAAWAQAGIGREQLAAGEAANNYALAAAIISGFSAFLLVLTVVYSRQSAQASIEAAKAAAHALKLELEGSAPFLVIEQVELEFSSLQEPAASGSRNNITLSLRNYGKAPAAVRRSLAYFTSGAEPMAIDGARPRQNAYLVVPPGEGKPLTCYPPEVTRGAYTEWENKSSRLFIAGAIDYRGPGGIERTVTFCWLYPFRGPEFATKAFGLQANPDNPLNHLSG